MGLYQARGGYGAQQPAASRRAAFSRPLGDGMNEIGAINAAIRDAKAGRLEAHGRAERAERKTCGSKAKSWSNG